MSKRLKKDSVKTTVKLSDIRCQTEIKLIKILFNVCSLNVMRSEKDKQKISIIITMIIIIIILIITIITHVVFYITEYKIRIEIYRAE